MVSTSLRTPDSASSLNFAEQTLSVRDFSEVPLVPLGGLADLVGGDTPAKLSSLDLRAHRPNCRTGQRTPQGFGTVEDRARPHTATQRRVWPHKFTAEQHRRGQHILGDGILVMKRVGDLGVSRQVCGLDLVCPGAGDLHQPWVPSGPAISVVHRKVTNTSAPRNADST